MPTFTDADPARFIADFYADFNDQLLNTDDDPAAIVDRFHTPDIVQFADGHRIDRAGLIAHTRPIRKNRPSAHVRVHNAMSDGDRLSAHFTMHVNQRGQDLSIEVCFFGQFTPDGRMRSAHSLTRTAKD
ncbi:nuclear transport factor 2 family protein [Nocardia sp. NPDC127526]|uniref:nuclear transport factor 2 family protein n=1 Tax=Nocardia sp. NPDC127526 TaxID=3345393 RepID=UPI0036458539